MKKLLTFIALALLWFSVLARPLIYQLKIDGLACPFCAYGIEKSLSRLQGVEQVETDIQTGIVNFVMKDGAALSEKLAKGLIT
jgi:copper chaperone CopZ